MGQSRPLFVYFHPFLITISIIQIEKSVDDVLGIQTQGRRMVGTDKTTEQWRPPFGVCFKISRVLHSSVWVIQTHEQCDQMSNLFFHIWISQQKTIAQKHTKFAKVLSKLSQILNKPSKCCQISLNLCQNGKISPNLVTLLKTYNQSIM